MPARNEARSSRNYLLAGDGDDDDGDGDGDIHGADRPDVLWWLTPRTPPGDDVNGRRARTSASPRRLFSDRYTDAAAAASLPLIDI